MRESSERWMQPVGLRDDANFGMPTKAHRARPFLDRYALALVRKCTSYDKSSFFDCRSVRWWKIGGSSDPRKRKRERSRRKTDPTTTTTTSPPPLSKKETTSHTLERYNSPPTSRIAWWCRRPGPDPPPRGHPDAIRPPRARRACLRSARTGLRRRTC